MVVYPFIGSCGDLLDFVGEAQRRSEKFDLLLFTGFPEMSLLLQGQPFVNRVSTVFIGRTAGWTTIAGKWCGGPKIWKIGYVEIQRRTLHYFGFNEKKFSLFNLSKCRTTKWKTQVPLPIEFVKGAESHLLGLTNKRVLLNPFSTYSFTNRSYFWPHWEEVIEYLGTRTDLEVYLVGLHPIRRDLPGNFVDLGGKCDSYLEVFALAEMVDVVVTTTNALSMWGYIRGKDTIACCDRNCNSRSRFWEWNRHNKVVPFHGGFDRFKQELETIKWT